VRPIPGYLDGPCQVPGTLSFKEAGRGNNYVDTRDFGIKKSSCTKKAYPIYSSSSACTVFIIILNSVCMRSMQMPARERGREREREGGREGERERERERELYYSTTPRNENRHF